MAVDVSNTQMGSFYFNLQFMQWVNGSLCSCQYLSPILQDGHEVNFGGGGGLMLRGLGGLLGLTKLRAKGITEVRKMRGE